MEGRALSLDIVCRDSEEPGCSGSVFPLFYQKSGKQLTHIVRVIGRYLFFSLLRQSLKYMLVIDKSSGNGTRYWKSINNYS